MTLQDINITRCIKPKNFGEVIQYFLRYFSDACETGCGMSAYIRLVNNAEGVVHCYLESHELHYSRLYPSLELSWQLQLYP